jgi:hypothetical protein
MRSQEIFALAGLGQKEILLISVSQVARTTGLSHCTQTPGELLKNPYGGWGAPISVLLSKNSLV